MKSNRLKHWGFILIFAGFAAGIPGVWLLIAHSQYEATSRIQVDHHSNQDAFSTSFSSDPYFIETEFETIGSKFVLGKVVEVLHLDVEWGKRYANGQNLEKAKAIELLRQCMRLRVSGDVISIGVVSEDSVEAAKIANVIAESFREFYGDQKEGGTKVTIIDRAQSPATPIAPNRTLGRILLGAGVFSLLAGVRLLWRFFFAAPAEAQSE
ncbi:MAG TPA: hypothetical protein VIK28_07455 [Sedimentisphaerales bacterium]